ncbi:MAG TPA: hypothetical protein DCM71_02350 [Runella sp.]|nr:hypothetical protein [Runella sp.]
MLWVIKIQKSKLNKQNQNFSFLPKVPSPKFNTYLTFPRTCFIERLQEIIGGKWKKQAKSAII